MARMSLHKSVFHRVRSATVANATSTVAKLATQFFQVPLFLHYWSPEQYAGYILVTSIVAWIALLDVGYCQAGTNRMSHSVAGGDSKHANRTSNHIITFVSVFSLAGGALIYWLLLLFWNIDESSFGLTNYAEWSSVLFVATLTGLINIQISAVSMSLRAEGRYGTQTNLGTVTLAVDFIAIGISLASGGGLLAVIGGILFGRLVILMVVYTLVRIKPRVAFDADGIKSTLGALRGPALAHLAFPFGNVINNSGYLLLGAAMLSSVELLVFSTLRTMSRLVDLVSEQTSNILSAEAAYAAGSENYSRLRIISAIGITVPLVIGLAAGGGLFFFGKYIYEVWTNSSIEFSGRLFILLLAGRVLRSAWIGPASIISGLNRHSKMSRLAILTQLAGLIVASILFVFVKSPEVLGLCLLFTEVVLGIFVLSELIKVTNDSTGKLLQRCIDPRTYASIILMVKVYGNKK